MNIQEFMGTLVDECPDEQLSAPLAALWWDSKGDWERAHALVDELSSKEGMAVHAYLHRKEGSSGNADYWYRRSGTEYRRSTLDAEWDALVNALLVR